MALAYVGLGANLGDAAGTLRQALLDLGQLTGAHLRAASALYRSAPVLATGADFINAVAAIEITSTPLQLLRQLQAIEQRHGRLRPYPNAPRTLDLDLLLYDELELDTPTLTLPHPRLHERAFVLVPLLELAPTLVLPGLGPAAPFLHRLAHQRIHKLA